VNFSISVRHSLSDVSLRTVVDAWPRDTPSRRKSEQGSVVISVIMDWTRTQPVVKPVVQPVVSCKRGIKELPWHYVELFVTCPLMLSVCLS